MSAAKQPTLMSLTNEIRNIGGASSRSLKDILADLKRVQGVTSAAPPAPAPAPPAPAPAPPAPAPAPPAPAPATSSVNSEWIPQQSFTETGVPFDAPVNYEQWASSGIVEQLGFKGPIYQDTSGPNASGDWVTSQAPTPELKAFVDQARNAGYDFVEKRSNLQNYNNYYGFKLPSGEVEVIGRTGDDDDVKSLLRNFVLPVGTAILGLPKLGSSITQSIGSSILPAEIATKLGSTLNLAPEVLSGALGKGVINAGIQAALGGDASDILRAGVLPVAAPVVSSAVGQGLEALMPADIGVVAKPITDAAQSALTRGALAGISGGSISDVIGESLLGSTAQAVGAEFGLSPKASQGLLDIVRSDGGINPVSLFQTAAEVSQSLSKPSADIRAEGQEFDTGGGGDVEFDDFSQLPGAPIDDQGFLSLPIDTSVEEPLLTTDILPGGLGALGQSIPFTGPPDPVDMGPTVKQQLYSDAGYGEGMTGEQTDVFDTVLADTGDVQAAFDAAINVAPTIRSPTTRSIRSLLRGAESRTERVRQPTPVITPTYADTFDFGLDAYGGAGGDAGGADAAQTVRQQLYSDAGYGEGMTGEQTQVFDTVLADTGNVQAAAQAASETPAEMLARIRRQVYGDPAYGQAMTGAETQAFDETFNDVLTETGDVNKALNDAVLAADTAVLLIGPDGNEAEFQGPPDPALDEFRDQNPAAETIQVVGTRDPINIIDYQEQVGKDLADVYKDLDLIDYQEQVGKDLADAQKSLDVISLPVTEEDELGFDVVPDISDGYPPPASDETIETIDVVGKREESIPSGLDPYEEKAFEEFLRQYEQVPSVEPPFYDTEIPSVEPPFYDTEIPSVEPPFYDTEIPSVEPPFYDTEIPSVEPPFYDTEIPSVEPPFYEQDTGGGRAGGGAGGGGGGAGGGAGGGGGTTTPTDDKGFDINKLFALLALMGQKEPEAAQKPNVAQIPQRGLEALMYGFKPGSGPYG